MRLQVLADHEEMSRRAAARIGAQLRRQPGLLLGAATGATPLRAYQRLAAMRAAAPTLFRAMRVVKLDEWLGVPAGHSSSCESYLARHLLAPLRIPAARYRGFRPRPDDPVAECARMARWLARHGPIDLCVLGLGRNGHLLMNEPAASLPPFAHVARLTEQTRRHSMVSALESPPRRGLTFGLSEILRSRSILLLVSGPHKRAALARTLKGEVTTQCPASLLWLHADVTVLCDREAAGTPGGRRR